MQNIIYRQADPGDYAGMLGIQSENFIGNLDAQVAREGFLSIEYSREQFDEISRDLGVAVAVRDDRIVGYLCATGFAYGARFPVLAELIRSLAGRTIGNCPISASTTFIYGPVCIERSARGRGVLKGLFGVIRELALPRYRQCILFVSAANPRSFHAHTRKLGMHDLGMFEFNGKPFHMLGSGLGDGNGGAE